MGHHLVEKRVRIHREVIVDVDSADDVVAETIESLEDPELVLAFNHVSYFLNFLIIQLAHLKYAYILCLALSESNCLSGVLIISDSL